MSEYNIFPAVDSDLNFPPSVRQQLLASREMVEAFGLKAPLESPKFTGTPTGIKKEHVGLDKVDNTSDADKPLSDATIATYIPKWKPATEYVAGQQVVGPNPINRVLTCETSHTSSSSIASDFVAKWRGNGYSGTTEERDAMFGPLTTPAQQVALANRRVMFYNETLGLLESYYSPVQAGTTLKVQPLIPGNPAGWYPTLGSILRAHRGQENGFQALIPGGNGFEPEFGDLRNSNSKFTKSGKSGIAVPYGGFYRIIGNGYYSGPASDNIVTNIYHKNGSIFRGSGAKPNPYDAEASATEVYPLMKNDVVSVVLWVIAATSCWGSTGYNGSRLSIEYAGPPLTNS